MIETLQLNVIVRSRSVARVSHHRIGIVERTWSPAVGKANHKDRHQHHRHHHRSSVDLISLVTYRLQQRQSRVIESNQWRRVLGYSRQNEIRHQCDELPYIRGSWFHHRHHVR